MTCAAVWRNMARILTVEIPVGAAAGCDLLTLIVETQDQKIAAFGSSYTGWLKINRCAVSYSYQGL
ncbi:hypothetical protein ACOI9X_15560 [Pseudomonas sp. P2757]|uniref:hypothetical protein n=1 Tax=unclassified Pseudomonas TaxID=196821 RepID=UPI003B5C3D49